MRICAFTAICEEDSRWISQYLREMERLDIPFVMHFDRCSQKTKSIIEGHPLCIGHTSKDDPKVEYTEQHKQGVMDFLRLRGECSWAIALDIDEVWEREAPTKLKEFSKLAGDQFDYAQVTWLNLWGDIEHIRIDGPFNFPPRVKLYNLRQERYWYFDHSITNGCKMLDPLKLAKGFKPWESLLKEGRCLRTDLVCLHHGNLTRELREIHRDRWNRIYSDAVGNNPYGFWDWQLDEVNNPPVIARHSYL